MDNNLFPPKIDIPQDKGAVPLNQPFPKEVANAPIVEVAEQVGQTAVASSLNPETITASSPGSHAMPSPNLSTTDSSDKKNEDEKQKAADANENKKDETEPAKQPQKTQKDEKAAATNPLVKLMVIVGVVLVAIGLIIAFFALGFGILLMAAGALLIIIAVFVLPKLKKGQ